MAVSCSLTPLDLYPQEWGEPVLQVEELLFRDEEAHIPVEIFEKVVELQDHPLNLNMATPDQLGESCLFTPFQIFTLTRYREKYGDLFSLFELTGLPGFTAEMLRQIEPFVCVEPGTPPKPVFKARSMLMIQLSRIFPESSGYLPSNQQQAPSYAGSPLASTVRFKTRLGNHLAAGLSYQKDPGETYFQEHHPEFLSGHLSYHGNGLLRQLVAGDFQLHHGSGLVNGAGFMISPESYLVNRNPISSLKSYASVHENRFERGMGCRLGVQNMEMLVWASRKRVDLSHHKLKNLDTNAPWPEYQSSSGLHRTAYEISGRDLARRSNAGIQVTLRHRKLVLGTMWGMELWEFSGKGKEQLQIRADPFLKSVCSLHGRWHSDRIELFGEAALSQWRNTALQAGMRYHPNDFFQGVLLFYHYGSSFEGIQPHSYASGSHIQNEQGMAAILRTETGSLLNVDFQLELFNYPSPRYHTAVPSLGFRYSCTLSSTGIPPLQWRLRLTKKIWQTTPAQNKAGIPPVITSEVTRLDIRMDHDQVAFFHWQSRLVISLLSGSLRPVPGYAVAQQVNITPLKNLSCRCQFLVFHIADWDNRIYLYEPGLYYNFNFPVCYGKGQKVTSVISWKICRSITLSGKASAMNYYNRKETGSGNDLRSGSKKWELACQFRLRF